MAHRITLRDVRDVLDRTMSTPLEGLPRTSKGRIPARLRDAAGPALREWQDADADVRNRHGGIQAWRRLVTAARTLRKLKNTQ